MRSNTKVSWWTEFGADPRAAWRFLTGLAAGLGTAALATACGGGDGPTDPTPPEPPAISAFAASPSQIEFGAATTLTWTTDRATACSISEGVGTVPCSGSRQHTPDSPTTYTLTATGPGGSRTAATTITFVPPSLAGLAPDQALPGQALQLTLTGTGFVEGETEVAVAGQGTTVSDLVVMDATTLGITLTLSPDAAAGERAVRVTTPAGTSGEAAFRILPLPVPVVQQADPATGTQGTEVSVLLTGSGFVPGATAVSVSGSGVSVGAVEVSAEPGGVTGASLTATMLIAEDAAPGVRELIVATPGGASEPVPFTVQAPAPAGGISMVAAGSDHTCGVLASDGSTWCFGYGTSGNLGGGVAEHSVEPVRVVGDHAFVHLSGGRMYTCGLTEAGQAWCWGRNTNGRLGNGDNQDTSAPVAVSGGHAFTQLATGIGHSCGIAEDGRAWCWGNNTSGQLGNGASSTSLVPVPVTGDHTFVSIATSPAGPHTCGVRPDGVALCWGRGTLGNGSTTSSLTPIPVAGGHAFQSVAIANSATCALATDGAAWCWGSGTSGRLGNGSSTSSDVPVPVAGGHTFTQIAGGHNGSFCALATDQQIYCWGSGSYGRLGNGSTENRDRPTPVAGGHAFTSVTLGGSHACGRTTDGSAWCWGFGSLGRLGNGGTTDELVPVQVTAGPFRPRDS